MAKLAKILKQYSIDRIIGYIQLPPDKDGKILFGWQEKNDLPAGEKLVISSQMMSDKSTIVIATKKDYENYFRSLVGSSAKEWLEQGTKSKKDGVEVNVLFIEKIASFLTNEESFSWNELYTYDVIPEIVD